MKTDALPGDVQVLGLAEVPAGREFCAPDFDSEDLTVLESGIKSLFDLVSTTRPPAGEDGYDHGGFLENGRTFRHVVMQWTDLLQANHLVFVGFCGTVRDDAPGPELVAADEQMIRQFPSQRHLLSYTTLARCSKNYVNLVVLRDPQGIQDWQENQVHAEAVAALAHRTYHHIRLHRGVVPGGLGGQAPLRFTRSSYYHYTSEGRWVGLRHYEEDAP